MENQENELNVEFTDKQKKFGYKGQLGGVIGNILTLIQMIYRTLKDEQKAIFKKGIQENITNSIVFMSDAEIEEFLKKVQGGKK